MLLTVFHAKREIYRLMSFSFNVYVQVAGRSKAWVCGRSHAEIAGSNSTGGGHACLSVVGVVCCTACGASYVI